MQIVILDDETSYRENIARMIRQWAEANSRGNLIMMREFNSSEDLVEAWKNGFKIDLMFLDIIIPNEIDGIGLAREIVGRDENVQIVYITNYADYALMGYEVNALRFLMKPVAQDKISACLDIAWNKWKLSQKTFVRSQSNGSQFVFAAQEMVYAESRNHRVLLHFFDGRGDTEIPESMSALQKKLPDQLFIQCHRSYVVNIRYVRKVKAAVLVLSDHTQLPIGRKYLNGVRRAFDHYYQGDIRLEQYI